MLVWKLPEPPARGGFNDFDDFNGRKIVLEIVKNARHFNGFNDSAAGEIGKTANI